MWQRVGYVFNASGKVCVCGEGELERVVGGVEWGGDGEWTRLQ